MAKAAGKPSEPVLPIRAASPLAPVFLQRLPNGDFDRRIIAVLPIEPERFDRMQWGLRHEPRRRAVVPLRGMDKEGMTQIDRAGFAGRREESRHIEMRPDAYSRRRVTFPDVGKQEQHQQRAIPRSHVDAPGGEVLLFIRIAIFAGKTEVDMPPGIAGIVRMRKTHRENAKTVTPAPTPFADDLIERCVKLRCIDRLPERLLSVAGESHHGHIQPPTAKGGAVSGSGRRPKRYCAC